MSDDMIVMKNGKVMENGNAETIYRNPQSEYTRELLDAIPSSSLLS
jgi:peptide/nickel transport system ATP-binding protein